MPRKILHSVMKAFWNYVKERLDFCVYVLVSVEEINMVCAVLSLSLSVLFTGL